MIALDASVVIAQLEAADAHHAAAGRLLDDADDDLGLGPLTLAEVLAGAIATDRLEAARSALDALEIVEVPLGADAARRLAALRVRTRLRIPDCCVLLAAEDMGASALLTFDARLAAAARERGLDVPG